ncbi:MAG: nitroreductase family protein [Eubacterium sp.]|nr:nitroreductase family protein [Eubacterium sp.]
MNLYEAIFVRKTVRHFTTDEVSGEIRDKIRSFYSELPGMSDAYRTKIELVDNRVRGTLLYHPGPVKCPYYIAFYTADQPRSHMNVGCLMQQVALYLCTLGLGTCMFAGIGQHGPAQEKDGLSLAGVLAFGYARGQVTRQRYEARRLPLEKLCVIKEKPSPDYMKLLEAARLAPSVLNTQPWRFVVNGNRIHFFTKKHDAEKLERHRNEELNFGMMFANFLVAAEELWIDADLIRLENISQKNFPHNRYILSALLQR